MNKNLFTTLRLKRYKHYKYVVLSETFAGSSPARLAVSRTSETVEEKITQVSESPKEKVQKPLLYET